VYLLKPPDVHILVVFVVKSCAYLYGQSNITDFKYASFTDYANILLDYCEYLLKHALILFGSAMTTSNDSGCFTHTDMFEMRKANV